MFTIGYVQWSNHVFRTFNSFFTTFRSYNRHLLEQNIWVSSEFFNNLDTLKLSALNIVGPHRSPSVKLINIIYLYVLGHWSLWYYPASFFINKLYISIETTFFFKSMNSPVVCSLFSIAVDVSSTSSVIAIHNVLLTRLMLHCIISQSAMLYRSPLNFFSLFSHYKLN